MYRIILYLSVNVLKEISFTFVGVLGLREVWERDTPGSRESTAGTKDES